MHRHLAANAVLSLTDSAIEDTVALIVVLGENVAEGATCGRTSSIVGVLLEESLECIVQVCGVCVWTREGFDLWRLKGVAAMEALDLGRWFAFDLGYEMGLPAGSADRAVVGVALSPWEVGTG